MQRTRSGSSRSSSEATAARRARLVSGAALVWALIVYVAYWARYVPVQR